MRSDLADLELMIHAETEKAVRVSDDGDDKRGVWLAKQHLEFEGPIVAGKAQMITMPQWLAEKEGLV